MRKVKAGNNDFLQARLGEGRVRALAGECGFRPGAMHGNRCQYSLALEKPGDA